MVGRLKISDQADAVRHLFMELEQNAKRIKTCWFCNSTLPTMKLANQGYLTGNHAKTCPFEELGKACEQCITVRDDDDATKREAESVLSEMIEDLFDSMEGIRCPFPVCDYPQGHRMECPFSRLERHRKHT